MIYQIHQKTLAAEYVNRSNRFVMELLLDGKLIRAYTPNTGRMEEFLYKGAVFHVAPYKSPKFDYRLVSTLYQDSYVLLDTVRINDVFHELLKAGLVKEHIDIQNIKREFKIGKSRFDFLVIGKDGGKSLIEVKSCTLCHNGTAMFPDAPTERGQKHIRELNDLADEGYTTYNYYLICNQFAQNFIPNFHTDYNYGNAMLNSPKVNFRALGLVMNTPESINLEKTFDVNIAMKHTNANCIDKGSYLLILHNTRDQHLEIGKLGKINFAKGYYIYSGSAMNGLNSRIARHIRKRKKIHWHIDYLTTGAMSIKKVYLIRSSIKQESEIANKIIEVSDSYIPGFGASDTADKSHLFYFRDYPVFRKDFQDIVLNFRALLNP